MNQPNRRGAALLMVVFILGALALLATPFLISMVLQEKSSRGYLSAAQARAAASGARSYAVTQLLQGHEYREAHGGQPPWDTPEYDTFDEVFIPLDPRRPAAHGSRQSGVNLAALFPEGITNPRGPLWGLETQDEQGKLDRRSAPDAVATRLAGVVAYAGADPMNYFTRFAVRPSAWIAPQTIRRVDGGRVYIDDVTYFSEGSRVRVTDGVRNIEARVDQNHGDWDPEYGSWIAVSGGNFPAYGWIEVEQRHPLNVNTAKKEVLQAVLEGLRVRRGTQEISREEAAEIANRLIERPIRGEADFRKFLEELRSVLTDEEIQAIAINARCPTHLTLSHTEMKQQVNTNNPNQPVQWYEDWIHPHSRGTVPFAWRTENVYTIEASGIMNTPAATAAAETRFREVAVVAPPERLRWTIDDQQDFENFLQSDGFQLAGHSDYTRGYPFGYKVMTFPARPWLRSAAFPYGEFPGAGAGAPGNPPRGLRPAPAKDRRRVNAGMGWVNHFDDDQSGAEGRSLRGAFDQPVVGNKLLETNTNRTSEVRSFQINDPQNPANQVLLSMLPGGLEVWFKPSGGDPVLFDIAERDWENRLCCFVRGGEIILRACDATIERKAAEVRGRASFLPDTWYHLGAYWDSTKLGGISLFLDGHPVTASRPTGAFSHVDDQDRSVIAELSSTLTPTDTSVSISNAGTFPSNGVVQVGTEAIEYSGFSGSGFTNCVRGTRRTGPDPDGRPAEGWAHPAGAKVTLFGYSNPVDNRTIQFQWGGQNSQQTVNVVLDRVSAGRATLTEGFGVNTYQVFINKIGNPLATPPDPGGITATDTTIPVFPAGPIPMTTLTAYDTTDFPSRGYIKIGSEVIFYSGKTPISFTGCQRGQLGTTADLHGHLSPIELFGFQVSTTAGYPVPCLLQLDDEWFAACQPAAGNYFTGLVAGGIPDRLRRGWRATRRMAHLAGAKVIPLFAVRDSSCGSEDLTFANPTLRDVVTVLDRAGNKEQRTFRVVRNYRRDANGNVIWAENLAAFDDFVNQDYVSDMPFTRILKFPSGELLSRVPNSLTIGGAQAALGGAGGGGGAAAGGGAGMMIDELRYYVAGSSNVPVVAQPVTAQAATVIVNGSSNMPRDGGLIVIGDEIIAYREFAASAQNQPGELRRCDRGVLGSTPGVHDMGERVLYLGMIPAAVTAGPLSGGSPILTLAGSSGAFAGEGYVLADTEVVGYTRKHQNAMNMAQLDMPVDRRGEGILRGCYGTPAAGHPNETLVVGIPFRYWDRFKPRLADSQMVCYGASKAAPGATWKSVKWTQDARDKNLEVILQARFDGSPAWDATPSARPGGLYEFSGGAGGFEVTADSIELRFLFGFGPRSFFPNHSWKRVPTVLSVAVEYEQPTRTLYHEER